MISIKSFKKSDIEARFKNSNIKYSAELEILKKYLEKLGVLEEEIVKLNYRSNLENELEQVKRYTNNN